MKINPQSPSKKPSMQAKQQDGPTGQGGINLEPLYAKVNKPKKQPSEETIYAPQNPPETIYAPQNPPGNPYAAPRGGSNPRRLVDPYSVTDLRNLDGHEEGYYTFKNPLYQGVGTGGNGEPIYEEIDVGGNGGLNVQSRANPLYQGTGSVENVEPIYEEIDVGGNGGLNVQSRANPLYQGVGNVGNSQESPEPPPETIYAPQNPPENAYMAPRGGSNPRRLVDPYSVTDLRDLEGHQEGYYTFKNPLYQGVGTGGNGAQSPQGSIENSSAQGPAPNRATPSPKEQLTQKLQENSNVQQSAEEVYRWSKIVFGKASAMERQLSSMLENPEEGRQIAQRFADNTENIGNLAGIKVLGVKSQQRKQAEAGVKSLCEALKSHSETVEKQYQSLTKSQERQQDDGRGERSQRHPSEQQQRQQHAREQRQHPPQHDVQPRRQAAHKGMAFAM
ncbi:BID domain-containing T4SS effector [Candidatus Bartonella washoeensis]|uniref:Uncharacterized protein n=1 Tax=Cardidatus Bartonella washoeensis 085-0475 TaxID=1094564 RepID=J0ZFH9_9HYPH|nr:BID domain-containing T4SS effector [Bartonella washoeensis]EJF86808.1 hypothetical protein MCW_00031 [Bartonella washoeensis 085-0475]